MSAADLAVVVGAGGLGLIALSVLGAIVRAAFFAGRAVDRESARVLLATLVVGGLLALLIYGIEHGGMGA